MTKKILLLIVFVSILVAQNKDENYSLPFVPYILEGKKILSSESLIHGNFIYRSTSSGSTVINQKSFDENDQLLESATYYSVIAANDNYFMRAILSAEEVVELKEGMDILLEDYKQYISKRGIFTSTDYTIRRNSNQDGLISYSTKPIFDTDEAVFTDKVVFNYFDDVAITISYFTFPGDPRDPAFGHIPKWFINGIEINNQKQFERVINKLYERVLEDLSSRRKEGPSIENNINLLK